MEQKVILSARGISKSFGLTPVLKNVDLELKSGEVRALLGENGAGKSTLIKIFSGALKPDSGVMSVEGQAYCPESPLEGRKKGLAVIYQELNLAPHLSVEENIMLGQEKQRLGFVERKKNREKIKQVLSFLHHPEISPDIPVWQLPIGARQVVEIARALVSKAKILIMDEPTSSLSQEDSRRLFEIIRSLKAEGVGIIYVSHFLEEVMEVADTFTVLRDGEVTGAGEIAGTSVEQLISLMIGKRMEELYPEPDFQPGEVILKVENLQGQKMGSPVTLTLRRGEILGVAGLVGSGRTEFLRAVFGLDRIKGGLLIISGKEFRPRHPRESIKQGLGFLSEDRQVEGLALKMNISDNLTLSRLDFYSRYGFLDHQKQKESARQLISQLGIKARNPEQPVWTLSGGNQQKVALARLLHQQAEVFLLDEPTRGIDVLSKAHLYELIVELSRKQKAVIFVSSYFPELLGVCQRIAVFYRGKLVDVREREQWTEEALMKAAITGNTDNSISKAKVDRME
ncbi:MAG: sugar ABC transporter ATP-binding protein [Candidatus Aminicenantes bacterium]|nr:sugar ABC transporter ATP-binding protein [Candidatus Aminicenantes bacterium]